jgi:transposase-like protein
MSIGENQVTYKRTACQACGNERVCQVALVGAGIRRYTCGPCYKARQAPIRKQLEQLAALKAQWLKEAGET